MPTSHPAYNTKTYRDYRSQLKLACQEGAPLPCSIAGPKCQVVARTPHHIVPLSKGGSWGEDNLTPSCSWCNNWMAHKTRKQNRAEQQNITKHPDYYR